jgi:hypothetical protein
MEPTFDGIVAFVARETLPGEVRLTRGRKLPFSQIEKLHGRLLLLVSAE